jgi:hypothetical protein
MKRVVATTTVKIRGEAQPSALILYQISVVQHLAVL